MGLHQGGGNSVAESQLVLRVAGEQDEAFLQKLYADTRAEELEHADWNPAQKKAFLSQQYAAQKAGYTSSYPDSLHEVVSVSGVPVGRIWVACEEDQIRLLDLALLCSYRQRGIEEILMRRVMQKASAMQVPVRVNLPHEYHWFRSLLVELGFRCTLVQPQRTLMEWLPREPAIPGIITTL